MRWWRFDQRVSIVFLMTVFCVARTEAQIPCRYEVTVLPDVDCGVFGGPGVPVALTNDGIVVGWFGACSAIGDDSFWWGGGPALHVLPRPTGIIGLHANDASNAHQIVGEARFTSATALTKGFIYDIQTGQYTFLDPPSGTGYCAITAINSAGTVCGNRAVNSELWGAFTWSTHDGFAELGPLDADSTTGNDINDSNVVTVDTGVATPGTMAYFWNGARLSRLGLGPNGLSSWPGRLNSQGVAIVGVMLHDLPSFIARGFTYDHGLWVEQRPLAGDQLTNLTAIADNGLVVGVSRTTFPSQITRGCRWSNGTPSHLLGLIPDGILSSLDDAYALNDLGQIVVGGHSASGSFVTALLNPIEAMTGDTDCNRRIDIDDLVNVITAWGPCLGCSQDLDGDQSVDLSDLVLVIDNWSTNFRWPLSGKEAMSH